MEKNFYNATITMLTVEQKLIWSRYNSMLVANSIIWHFLFEKGVNPPQQQPQEQVALIIFGCIGGYCLSFCWYLLNVHGWNHQNRYLNHSKNMNFGWFQEINPIHMVSERLEKKGTIDWIYWIAQIVVGLFMVGYLCFLFSKNPLSAILIVFLSTVFLGIYCFSHIRNECIRKIFVKFIGCLKLWMNPVTTIFRNAYFWPVLFTIYFFAIISFFWIYY